MGRKAPLLDGSQGTNNPEAPGRGPTNDFIVRPQKKWNSAAFV